jgi:prepilin-type N-terminal cleavage/methylation domain-containing protein/prepilin-type processing-associated H-X9-DG protein
MKARRGSRGAAGFTLVELLVVIGIIALLVSILLPVMGRAREAARRAQCLSNMRQIAMAVLMYHHERRILPGPLNIGVGDPETVNRATNNPFTAAERRQQASSIDILQKYLNNSREVWFCPSSTELRESARAVSNSLLYNWTYKFNNQPDTHEPFFFGSWTSTRTEFERQPKKLSQVRATVRDTPGNTRQILKSHSEIWMLSDLDGRNFTIAHTAKFGITDNAIDPEQRPWQPVHKSGRIGRNYAFFDGHAEWLHFDGWPVNP